jgi:hypothetical protein
MNQIAINLMLTKPGVELALFALTKLPYEQSAGLIREIEGQANAQLENIRKLTEAENFSETTKEIDL